jgi:hypothetical protein
MAYPSEWEWLSDAATRVMEAAGVSKDEAQSDICQAIADGAVKIRCQLKRHKTKHMTSKAILDGNAFQITKLKPDDLDWEGSHPVKPWTVQRGSYAIPGDWDLAWVKLSRTDVTNRLCPAAPRGEPAEPVSSSETGAKACPGRGCKPLGRLTSKHSPYQVRKARGGPQRFVLPNWSTPKGAISGRGLVLPHGALNRSRGQVAFEIVSRLF